MAATSPRMAWAYPSRDADPWYDEFDDFVVAADASGFASREDRSLIFAGGGTIAWTLGSETLSWSGVMYVLSPITGRLIQVASGSETLEEGEVLYLSLTRQALSTVSVSLQKASSVPSNDQDIILCFRRDNRVYFRTGFSLGNGDTADSLAPTPGSSGGAPLVVEDEGIGIEPDTRLVDFVGDGVTVTSTGPNDVQVAIPGMEVEKDGGSIETAVDTIDFRGPLTVVNVAPEEVRVTVNGLDVQDEGGPIEPDVTTMDFIGAGVTAAKTGAGAVSVTIPGGGGVDPNAIHDNVAAEISAVALKGVPTVSDFLLIEDAAAGDAKKHITIGSLPGGGGTNLTEYDWASGYLYTQLAVPVEETMGNGRLDGSQIQATAYFRATWDPQFGAVGNAYIRLYDLGPAAGPPAAPVLIATLTTASSGLRYDQQALAVGGAPGANQIANTPRMYEVTVDQGSQVGDTVDVGSAGISDR